MGSATSTSARTCTPTLSCLAAPPCTPVSPIVCRRKSPPSPRRPSRSRSSLPLSANTTSGSVAPSWPPCPPSNRCGFRSRSTTNPAPALSTASASKLFGNTLDRISHSHFCLSLLISSHLLLLSLCRFLSGFLLLFLCV